jgi:hypothetical protein
MTWQNTSRTPAAHRRDTGGTLPPASLKAPLGPHARLRPPSEGTPIMHIRDYPLKARHDDLLRAAPSRPAAPPGRRSSRRLNSWPRSRWFSLPTLVLVPSVAISAAIVVTAPGSSALHVAPAWAWLLTSAQIAGMWLVGNSKPHGWLVGAVAQPAWLTYAILSDQYGFIPGCAVSLVVQIWNFSRQTGSRPETTSYRHLAHNLRSVTERALRRPRHHGIWRQRFWIGAGWPTPSAWWH